MPERNIPSIPLNTSEGKTPSGQLMDLMRQYGSIKNIPDETLLAIGYMRTENGQISSVKAVHEQIETARRGNTMENKTTNKPFGEIAVRLTKTEIMTRRLKRDETKRLYHLTDYETVRNSMKIFLENNDDIRYFKEEFIKFLNDQTSFNISDVETFSKMCDFLMSLSMPNYESIACEMNIAQYYDEGIIPTEESAHLLSIVNRSKGILCDRERSRQELLESVDPEDEGRLGYPIINISDPAETYLKENGCTTLTETILYLCHQFLLSQGFSIVATIIQSCHSLTEMQKKLMAIKKDELPDGLEEIRLQREMRSLSLEEKRSQSDRLKRLKKSVEKQRHIILGMANFFLPDILEVNFFHALIKKIQNILIASKTTDETGDFYLDSTPNDELDKDPGVISGDCTAGRPLPFGNPDIPVYNVKIYDAERKHIGNIYLLVTTDNNDNLYWHLEAIQIPEDIDWNTSAGAFIDRIAEEAQKQNIQGITINAEDGTISNYDFIESAMRKLHQERTLEDTEIMIPNFDNTNGRYSNFQGDGHVLLLWQKENEKLKSV